MIVVIKRGAIVFIIGFLVICIVLCSFHKSTPAANYIHENTKCIIIDPGHGIPDGGAVSKTGIIESPLNLKIALKLKEELVERGYKVVLTRSDENGLDKKKKTDMYMRLDIMKNTPADVFISIHMNKFPQSKYRGCEVLYSANYTQSTLLAQMIMNNVKEIDPKTQTRNIKQADKSLFLMKNATIPAVIVECGFLSNPEEEQLLTDKSYQARIAGAICDGITEYYKNVDNTNKINIISEAST